jgi:hypothetical protein
VCSDIMFYFLHRSNERRNAERETWKYSEEGKEEMQRAK